MLLTEQESAELQKIVENEDSATLYQVVDDIYITESVDDDDLDFLEFLNEC